MPFEHKRGLGTERLTRTQERLGQSIVQDIKDIRDHRVLVILDGLSGVGKSVVLSNINQAVGLNGGRIVDPDALRWEHRAGEIAGYNGHFVTSSTVGVVGTDIDELKPTLKKRYPDLTQVVEVLPAMDGKEIRSYVSSLSGLRQATLKADQIVKYSLGIPLLAQLLVARGLTVDAAKQISADYLRRNFRAQALEVLASGSNKYFQMGLPQDLKPVIEDMFSHFTDNRIYNWLGEALHQQQLLEQEGVHEESPIFVAPESEGIYDNMLQQEHGFASIDVFVPNLSDQDITRIQEALGFHYYDYNPSHSPRAQRMFHCEYRKMAVYDKDESGQVHSSETEAREIESTVAGYEKALAQGRLGIIKSDQKGKARFFIHKHEHPGMTYAPALVGWMIESLLQQRGIAYFVNNGTYGKAYVYDPDSKHIKLLPKLVEIKSY